MVQQLTSRQNKKYIFVDTCIIQFTGDKLKSKSEAVLAVLASFKKEGFDLAISEISMYENLHGKWGSEAKKLSALLNYYEWKQTSSEVLYFASVIGGLYSEEFSNERKDISIADKIIAATTILEDGYVLTANHKDFPNPFFITERSLPIAYKKNNYSITLDMALYKPNTELIFRRFNEKRKV